MAKRRRNKHIEFENLQVIDAGAKGKAVAKAPDGRVVFIDNAVPGDVVNVQTYRKRKGFYHARVTEVVSYSDKRSTPVCEHFGTCGGCKWQNMQYESQLFYKEKEVLNNLVRIGKVELPEVVSPIVGSEEQYFYRNKMEFSFSNNKWLTREQIDSGEEIENKNALGFNIPGMWDKILDLNKCHLQGGPSNAIRDFVKAKAIELEMPFFDVRKKEGLLRNLMIRTSSTEDVMVLIQFHHEDENNEVLLNAIQKEFPSITSLLYVINDKGNDTIYDLDVQVHYGEDHIMEEMEGLKFKVNAKSFYQTNSKQAYVLYKIVRDFAALKGDEIVYDLYTGTGTIAQFVAKDAKKVIGVEAVPDAILAAEENAKRNNIDNTTFLVGDMRKVFDDNFASTYGSPDLIITDPPREGMHPDVVKQLITIAAPRIVYVSCNSATQARDLEMLKEHYKLTKVQPVDMFPQTHHVENVVLLEKLS
ncbi:MAG TPA: 23S rRNA (uracil(1939)-C(5))-methyltransferase RlmD [Flavobacteriaceae bacterium]|nr:23S rRNA (uracil(1939)-C(5))-methyltransferase RlmD [Flavobacteriaceae bacterium]